jgi:hypothetical protein
VLVLMKNLKSALLGSQARMYFENLKFFVDPAQIPALSEFKDTLAYRALYYRVALLLDGQRRNISSVALWGPWLTNAEEHRHDDMKGRSDRALA